MISTFCLQHAKNVRVYFIMWQIKRWLLKKNLHIYVCLEASLVFFSFNSFLTMSSLISFITKSYCLIFDLPPPKVFFAIFCVLNVKIGMLMVILGRVFSRNPCHFLRNERNLGAQRRSE